MNINTDMNDDQIYKIISDELSSDNTDSAAWTRAFASANGNPDLAKAHYIKARFAQLKKSISQSQIAKPETNNGCTNEQNDIENLRFRIQARLAIQKKATFYDSLGLLPTCAEQDLITKINEITSSALNNSQPLKPEIKFAISNLQDGVSREQYDRKLWADLQAPPRLPKQPPVEHDSIQRADSLFLDWWETKKTSFVVVAIALLMFGYLGKDFFTIKSDKDVKKDVVKVQSEAVRAAKDIEMGKVDNQRYAIQEGAQITNKVIDRSAEIENRRINIQETVEQRRGKELEYRANAGSEILDMQRKEQENRYKLEREKNERQERMDNEARANRDRQYWACMNDGLSRNYDSTRVEIRWTPWSRQ